MSRVFTPLKIKSGASLWVEKKAQRTRFPVRLGQIANKHDIANRAIEKVRKEGEKGAFRESFSFRALEENED
jgi:hypothetical protein